MNGVNVEVRLALLESNFERLLRELEERDKKAALRDKKLDELLELKNKGMGAFWLASLIIGTSLVTAATAVLNWFK